MHKIGTLYKLNIKPNFSKKEGEIIGIFAGDGSQYFEPKSYHYETNVHFGKKHLKYALYTKDLYERFFNKKFRLERSNPNTIRIRTYSKEIFYFFKNYLDYDTKVKHSTVKLNSNKLPLQFKIGFLKGLLDTDGSICFIEKEKRYRITFCTTSKGLAYQIRIILLQLKIKNGLYVYTSKHSNEKPVHYVNIWKNSSDKFINIVKPLKARIG